MYFYIFVLCLNTITSMINTNACFDFTDFQVPFESHLPRNRMGAVVEQSGQRQIFDVSFGFLLHQCNRCHLFGTCGIASCWWSHLCTVQRRWKERRCCYRHNFVILRSYFCYLFILTYHCHDHFEPLFVLICFRCCG